ncbi:hypothetical protein Angca_004320, partial [Angiostrongylus cantonensis]
MGRVVVFECITSHGALVPMNEERFVRGRMYKCFTRRDGIAILERISRRRGSCYGRPYGVEWQEGSIQYKCDGNGEVAFVGCLTSTGELIPIGETKSVGGDDMECKMDANGKPVLKALEIFNRVRCKDADGQERDPG